MYLNVGEISPSFCCYNVALNSETFVNKGVQAFLYICPTNFQTIITHKYETAEIPYFVRNDSAFHK